MKKRGAPTLLEISKRYPSVDPIARRRKREARPVREPGPTRSDSVDRAFLSLPPTIRVPTGYVFIASAAIIAVVFGGYFVGFSRGSAQERAQHGQQAARDLDQQSVRDPLLRTAQLNPQLLQAPRNGSPTIAASNQPLVSSRTAATSLAEAIVPISPDTDPRLPGRNYYIVARDLPDEAVRAATYLRQQGIMASAISTGRANRKLVVALEPFASDMATSQLSRDYKARIQEAGRLWKRDHRGTTDFSDCYLARYSN